MYIEQIKKKHNLERIHDPKWALLCLFFVDSLHCLSCDSFHYVDLRFLHEFGTDLWQFSLWRWPCRGTAHFWTITFRFHEYATTQIRHLVISPIIPMYPMMVPFIHPFFGTMKSPHLGIWCMSLKFSCNQRYPWKFHHL